VGCDDATTSGSGVVFLNWRDTSNPEGGGSELYAEQIAGQLVRRGHPVTIFCASYPGAPAEETLASGVRILRGGGRHTVYLRAAWAHLTRRLGPHGLVVDVQNGMPFLARLYCRQVVMLVHHVHREQWRVVLGPIAARFGWWVESWLSPRVNRATQYVTVSEVTRTELAELGIDPARIAVIYNGTPPAVEVPDTSRTRHPSLLVLGRLVPHKRVELAIRALADLLPRHPDAELVIAGRGWWDSELRAEADRLGIADRVRFAGFVDDQEKNQLLASSWVHLVPSVKEGWGLSVVEAAAYGLPSVAFAGAGGVAESIRQKETGLLAVDEHEFDAHVRTLVEDHALRTELGEAARTYARSFSWDGAGEQFAAVLSGVRAGSTRRSGARDELPTGVRARG
jgi:glycosyltransferase involved in cell wall biosynthesis